MVPTGKFVHVDLHTGQSTDVHTLVSLSSVSLNMRERGSVLEKLVHGVCDALITYDLLCDDPDNLIGLDPTVGMIVWLHLADRRPVVDLPPEQNCVSGPD